MFGVSYAAPVVSKAEAKIGVPNWCAISDKPVLTIAAKCGLTAALPRGNASAIINMVNMRPLRANCGLTGYSNAGRGAEIDRMRADLSLEGCRPHTLL